MARIKQELNWDVIDSALSYGANADQVRFTLETKGQKVSSKTIRRHIEDKHGLTFEQYRDYKMSGVRLKLQQKAVNMAMSGNATMMIFCLKNLCKWTDKQHIEQETKVMTVEEWIRIKEEENGGEDNRSGDDNRTA